MLLVGLLRLLTPYDHIWYPAQLFFSLLSVPLGSANERLSDVASLARSLSTKNRPQATVSLRSSYRPLLLPLFFLSSLLLLVVVFLDFSCHNCLCKLTISSLTDFPSFQPSLQHRVEDSLLADLVRETRLERLEGRHQLEDSPAEGDALLRSRPL